LPRAATYGRVTALGLLLSDVIHLMGPLTGYDVRTPENRQCRQASALFTNPWASRVRSTDDPVSQSHASHSFINCPWPGRSSARADEIVDASFPQLCNKLPRRSTVTSQLYRHSCPSCRAPLTAAAAMSRARRTCSPLYAQLNLRDVRSKEQGHCPIEDDTQAPVPPRHLE
jgi:hypothetical protein